MKLTLLILSIVTSISLSPIAMTTHRSATAHEETPHETETTRTAVSDARDDQRLGFFGAPASGNAC